MSVFDELERLHDSEFSTWQAQVGGATPEDIEALADIVGPRGLGADNWSGMNLLCTECSHGSPDPGHSHGPAPDGWTVLGLAGAEDALSECLEEWAAPRPNVNVMGLELLW